MRPEFSELDYTDLVQNYGYDVRWSKFMACPNFNPEMPEHHMPDCALCDHAGRIFYDIQTTRMVASSFALKPEFAMQGRYEHGTVYFTTLPGDQVSYRDRIELLTSRMRYSDRILLREGQLTYELRFPVLALDAARTNLGAVVNLSTLHVEKNGTVTFASLPPGADFVSVAYDHHPVYTVVDVMHVIRDSRTTKLNQDVPTAFNRQVVAQLEFTREFNNVNLPPRQDVG